MPISYNTIIGRTNKVKLKTSVVGVMIAAKTQSTKKTSFLNFFNILGDTICKAVKTAQIKGISNIIPPESNTANTKEIYELRVNCGADDVKCTAIFERNFIVLGKTIK